MASIVQRDALFEPHAAVTVGVAQTVVIAPRALLGYDKKCFTVKNAGAVALNSCKVQATAIEAGAPLAASTLDADWEDIDTTTLASLGAGAVKSVQITNDSRKWWRVVATVASSTTTALGVISAAGAA
jgi:hypothetical protein